MPRRERAGRAGTSGPGLASARLAPKIGRVAVSLLVLVVAFYAAVATAYAEARRHREAPPRWARIMGPLSVAAHLVGLFLLSSETARSPFANTSQALSFLAFALAALYLLLEATSRVATHGGSFYAVAACLAALSVHGLVGTDPEASVVAVRDPLRSWHVGMALLCAAAVLANGLLGAGYLGTYARVKRGRLEGGTKGPSLGGFERLSRGAGLLATLLLIPASVLGLATQRDDTSQVAVMILLVTGVVLLLMLVGSTFLWWFRPRRGALASWLTVVAAALLIVAFMVAHPLLVGGRA
jgi:cytochrome bd-type quinol oxidase subunit 2